MFLNCADVPQVLDACSWNDISFVIFATPKEHLIMSLFIMFINLDKFVVSCLTEYGFRNIFLIVFKTCEKGLRREYFVFCSDTYVTSFASFFQRDWFHAIFFQIWQELKSKLTVWLLATPFPHCKLFITFFLTQL